MKQKQPRIGLTGGFASGKSVVSSMFRELGCVIIDADKIAHELIGPDQAAYQPVIDAFGSGILGTDGVIDRSKLRTRIFRDPEKRQQINDILHPLIRAEMKRLFESYSVSDPHTLVIHDIPLLIETGSYKTMDIVILVYVTRSIQIQRLAQRDALSPEDAERLLLLQMPLENKKQFATYIIDNNKTLDKTRDQVLTIFDLLSAL